ncbi:uncharacterized protein N7482_004268 [Penicillium canariense]|uniref:Chromo domain-containing protein n=1 Tax=Penicillium canariense TaxID=189055 RepID=A0A9W9I626_9EURO|nr:uncharacterized protein N7482_004268 [Penicillium canariense]KAJ5168674.1 hypothetical protein N7482_004268 [Penicillium canariense]
MPPPVEDMSDEETGDIPFGQNNGAAKDTEESDQEKDEDEADEEEEQDPDIYIVEKINEHVWLGNGTLSLLVKWKGWEKPEDLTWEPEAELKKGANIALQEYYKSIGGRPKNPPKAAPKAGPGRKRKSLGETKANSTPESTEPKRRRKSEALTSEEPPAETAAESEEDDLSWTPKSKDWDNQIDKIDTIIRDQESGNLFAFLLWNNGRRSRVAISLCYDRCPRKMLAFYEQHLVFKDG